MAPLVSEITPIACKLCEMYERRCKKQRNEGVGGSQQVPSALNVPAVLVAHCAEKGSTCLLSSQLVETEKGLLISAPSLVMVATWNELSVRQSR